MYSKRSRASRPRCRSRPQRRTSGAGLIYVFMYRCSYAAMYLCIFGPIHLCIFVSISVYLLYTSMYLCIYVCLHTPRSGSRKVPRVVLTERVMYSRRSRGSRPKCRSRPCIFESFYLNLSIFYTQRLGFSCRLDLCICVSLYLCIYIYRSISLCLYLVDCSTAGGVDGEGHVFQAVTRQQAQVAQQTLYLCNYVSMYLCIYVSLHLRIYVSLYLCIYVSMHPCIYASMHLCMYGFIYG